MSLVTLPAALYKTELQRFLSSIHNQSLCSKKWKYLSNYYMASYFRCIIGENTVHRPPKDMAAHDYDPKRIDTPQCHECSWRGFGQSGHWQPNEELHQRQPREKGNIWSGVKPVSHFL